MTVEMGPETTSSNSFRVDHRPEVTGEEMSVDVKSYIYEFRLRAQKFDYDLALTLQDGQWSLGDPVRNEPMTAKAYRSVLERKASSEPSHREEAEFAGLLSLEKQLAQAAAGDSIIWFSPPGPAEEGFAEGYGFEFKGEVVDESAGKKAVKMTAYRLEKPTLGQYDQAFKLMTGTDFKANSADEYLVMPMLIKGGLSQEYHEMVLANTFGFVFDDSEAKRIDYIYERKLRHLELEYSANFHKMSPAERIKSIHAMENIADEARKMKHDGVYYYSEAPANLAQARVAYGHDPEEVKGSCPVTKSNNPLSGDINIQAAALGIDYPFDHFGNCAQCHGSAMLGPCDICLSCDVVMRTKSKGLVN